jgi:hypothetical protein
MNLPARRTLHGAPIWAIAAWMAAASIGRATDSPAAEPLPGSQAGSESGAILRASAAMLNDLMKREIKRIEPISEQILNVTTRGTADVFCRVGVQLVPNGQLGHIRVTMIGEANVPDGVGTTRNVRVYSSSRTSIRAAKSIGLAAEGIGIAPTRADCQTHIVTNGVSAPLRIIERIAWKKAAQMQPQAEAIVAQRAGQRASEQLDGEADVPLRKLHQHYLDGFYFPLLRKDALPAIRVRTTKDNLIVSSARPEAPAGPAPPIDGKHDVAVGFHQAYVGAMAQRLLGGTITTDKQLLEAMRVMTGQMPRALWVHDRAARWNVHLAERQPIELAIAEGNIDVTLRLRAATRGAERLERPIEIAAGFAVSITPDGPRLARRAAVVAKITDGKAVTPAEADLLDFLRRKFGGVFLEEIYFDGLVPPEGGTWAKLRRLAPAEFSAQNGWVVLGYRWQGLGDSLAVK